MIVGQLITKKLVTLPSSSSIKEVADKMVSEGVSSVILTEGEKFVGIVTERDIVRAVHQGVNLSSPASSIATKVLVKVEYDKSIYDAFMLMTSQNIRHLAIEKDGKCVGVVSIRDVARAFSLMLAEQMTY